MDADEPEQIVAPVPTTMGNGFTVTVTVVLPMQPLIPVTVYVVVDVGSAVTELPLVTDKPRPGVHV
jgi:hypothetical protein